MDENRNRTTARHLLLRPPALPEVKVGGFWGPRIDTVAERTVHILFDRAVAAGTLEQVDPDRPVPELRHRPHGEHGISTQMFWDSDLGKIVETVGYALHRRPDPALERRTDELIDALARLQDEDGYLDSWFQRMQPGRRWTNLRDCHELYNMGHLIEGAVSYFQATGKRRLLDVMCRCMDHVAAVFGRGPEQRPGYGGHPEIELALVKLARVTGERRYLDLARYFIDERGQQPHVFDREAEDRGEDPARYYFGNYEYSQSHRPVREQDRVVGHAVRAMYLYSGMADVAAEDGDETLVAALETLWSHLTNQNLYVTGGLGPSLRNEGFTADYDLPNDDAYAETCASVGLVFWASRMLGRGADRRFADVMEQALYNGALAGLSLDGDRFFYENPLASRGDHRRWTWHACPCCPPNIARLVASVGTYLYGVGDDEIAIHLFCESTAELTLAAGRRVRLTQATAYPLDGAVIVTVGVDAEAAFTISLRVPGWVREAKLAINGERVALDALDYGYKRLTRTWSDGDLIELVVDLPVERIFANPKVGHDLGRVALRRGPLVYCLEAADNDLKGDLPSLDLVELPSGVPISEETAPDLLGGIVRLEAEAVVLDDDWGPDLYRATPPTSRPHRLKAVPYYAWGNREAGAMSVWIRNRAKGI